MVMMMDGQTTENLFKQHNHIDFFHHFKISNYLFALHIVLDLFM